MIVDRDAFAEVSHVTVGRPFGQRPLVVPWGNVTTFGRDTVDVDIPAIAPYVDALPQAAVLLKDYILDKRVLDQRGRALAVVFDIGMALVDHSLLVLDVDLSRAALLRRVRLTWLAKLLTTTAEGSGVNRVPWAYVQPLSDCLGSFAGDVTLKVFSEQLAELPPVDLADVLEELTEEHRLAIFGELNTTIASDTLEALDPKVQRDLIALLGYEKTVRLIDEMTPGQAADLLSALHRPQARAIIALLADAEKAGKITSILETQEAKILDFSTSDFLRFAPETTPAQARAEFAQAAKRAIENTYLYVVGEGDALLGVLDTKELLLADEAAKLADVMTTTVIRLAPDDTLRRASELFARYLLRALPVTDVQGRILAVLPYRDVVALRRRYVGALQRKGEGK